MTHLRSTRMRSLFFGIAVFLILMLGTGSAAHDNTHGPIEASMPVVSASPASSNRLASPDSCLPDGNEPNDNPSQATPIDSSTGQANFHTTSDVDWYRYTAIGGSWHATSLSNAVIPYVFEVYNESTGQIVTSGISSSTSPGASQYFNRALWYAPINASYLIKVAIPSQASGLHTCGSTTYNGGAGSTDYFPLGGTYQIMGMVYHDSNWSSDWQIEEPVIESVTVKLLGPGGAVVATQSTNSDGVFRFADVAAGLYVLEQTDLDGFVSTTSNRVIVILSHQDYVVYFGDYYLPSRGSLQFLPLQLKQR